MQVEVKRSALGLSLPHRLAPVVALLVLAPFVAEFVLGNVPARQLYLLPLLVPLYGASAVLVRELGRRSGGWPSMILLALAYAIAQPALIEMSLFNPAFGGNDFTALYDPALGFSPYYALVFIVGHLVWSIAVPIALVEAIMPAGYARRPWLGPVGMIVVALLFALGVRIYFVEFQTTEAYMAPPLHLGISAAIVTLLVALALLIRSRRSATNERAVPGPLWVGIGAFVLSSIFFAAPEDWSGVAMKLAALAAAGAGLFVWTRSSLWTARHIVAVAGGTLLTYVWGAFVLTTLLGVSTPFDYIATTGVGLLAIGIAAIATLRRYGRI